MKNKLIYFTFFLLVAYSISGYFVPGYFGSDVLLLNQIRHNSDAYTSELKVALEESEEEVTKDIVVAMIDRANLIEHQRLDDTEDLIGLIKSHSLLLPGLLLLHFGVLLSALRTRNET
ncbi:hypothetical protein [Aliiglaciecola sp. M165]|uniref:hypothetical protein n=1 Tax=Aliiglaciecola sp. M165 TaxID=2593649 RepID=UPI00117E4BC3|nr:hypothetical protein [Aliiglaciecola sp. M165]TRY28676.1 hypothetical protein FM019_20665 [Aliiglaciecola sp. M165]